MGIVAQSCLTAASAPSRNEPCWCGSGKRFKVCHGALGAADSPNAPNVSAIAERLAQEALAAQRADDLPLAESRYRECLALDPTHANAMHMLGVVRLAAFDFAEARRLIEAAGALTQWQFSTYRHNYGFLLSAYLPANSMRPSTAQHAALQALRAQHVARSPHQVPVCAVLLHSVSRNWPGALHGTVQCDNASAALQLLHLPGDNASTSCAQVQALLATTDADYVSFASTDAPLDAKRVTELVALLEARGAGWGFSTSTCDQDAVDIVRRWPSALSTAAEHLGKAQFAEPLSAMCVAAPLLPLSIDNLVVRRSLLADIFWRTAHLPHALGEMVLALCRKDEPCLCSTFPFLISAAGARTIAANFADATEAANAAQRSYVTEALANASFANPLAPSLLSQGLSFLKRPLRYGAGAVLDAAALTDIAARIAAFPVSATQLRDDGFDLVGFARAESGLGENMRALSHACTTAGVPHSVIDIDIETGIRKSDAALDSLIAATPTFRHQITCVNPDALDEVVHHEGVTLTGCTYRIGYWFWELEKLPLAWVRAASTLHELWAG